MGNKKETVPIAKSNKPKNEFSKSLDKISISLLTFLYKNAGIIVMFVATIVAFYAKTMVIKHPTKDVVGFIFKWMDEIIESGHTNFYRVDADYSPFYLFFANLLSMIPKGEMIEVSGYTYSVNWITALKMSYFVVDILNAYAVYFIIHHVTGSRNKAVIGYLVMTGLPVQFINSAIWGQADCIYTCFLLYSVYFALRGKGGLSFFMFGFALANKLQAVFLAPFLVYLILRRKVKFTAVIYTPAAVFLSFLPAYFCGASFTEPFNFYIKQLEGYSDLTMNCPNFWQLVTFRNSRIGTINPGATYIALLFIGVIFAIVWLRLVHNNGVNLLNIAALLVGVTIFFLPHMHERYFYLLDILVVVYAISKGKRYFLIPLMQLASWMSYYYYIVGKHFINALGEDSLHIPALIVVAVLCTLFYDILHAERKTLDEVLSEIKEGC